MQRRVAIHHERASTGPDGRADSPDVHGCLASSRRARAMADPLLESADGRCDPDIDFRIGTRILGADPGARVRHRGVAIRSRWTRAPRGERCGREVDRTRPRRACRGIRNRRAGPRDPVLMGNEGPLPIAARPPRLSRVPEAPLSRAGSIGSGHAPGSAAGRHEPRRAPGIPCVPLTMSRMASSELERVRDGFENTLNDWTVP